MMGSSLRNELVPQVSPPKVPANSKELAIPAVVIENLLIKHLFAYPKSDLIELTQKLGVVSHIVEDALVHLRNRNLVTVFQPTSDFSTSVYSDVRYGLTELGISEADIAFHKDAYLGPVPISLDEYIQMVQAQDIRVKPITRKDVTRALTDVYGSQHLVPILGPAINSGRALLLYGHAGTGKSYVASKVLNALNTSVFIPYAVYADGNVIRVFSPQHHRRLDDNHNQTFASLNSHYDKRWALCERPNIQVGGELTMEMLEVNQNEHNRVWNAPLQMMANNGILVIDDLGRQTMPVEALLNRWIVPMEYMVDHLGLPNGQQISVPFYLTLAFSSNLPPSSIADPAFLRRIGYKIEFTPLFESDYIELWQEVAQEKQLALCDGFFDVLFELHRDNQVEFFPCLPKDLLGISYDILVFDEQEKLVSPMILRSAWRLYFTID